MALSTESTELRKHWINKKRHDCDEVNNLVGPGVQQTPDMVPQDNSGRTIILGEKLFMWDLSPVPFQEYVIVGFNDGIVVDVYVRDRWP